MKYVVDTDWIIDALTGQVAALESLEQRQDQGLAVSIVTLGEVYEGAYISPQPDQHIATFHHFLEAFTILPLTEISVQHFARLRAQLRRQGNLIPDLDLLIASTALEHNLILMTRNIRHFSRIPGLQII
jgi:tRNA(fMet)-specific endonuclease VapC